MRSDVRSAVAVVVAIALATLTALPLTSDLSFLPLSWLGVAALCGLGVVARRLGGGVALTAAAQLLVLLVGSLLLAAVLSGDLSLWSSYPRLWQQGILHMQTQGSPMVANRGVTLIFVTVVGLVGLITDLLVAGIDRPAWSMAPLATLFCVPALGLGLDTGLFSFSAVALGYLAILVADGVNRASAWTRGLSGDSSGYGSAIGGPDASRLARNRSGTVVWRAAGLLAAPALVLTAILGVLLPTITIPGLGLGNGSGGNGPLQLTDPSLDLRRNLNQPADRVVFRYTTDQPNGVYLRMASLPQFSAAGFGNTQIRLSSGTTLPAAPGYTGPTPAVRTTRVTVDGFGSQYLPLPYAPHSFTTAEGEWSYNPDSLVVVNRDNDPSVLRTLTYEATSYDIEPTAAELATAGVGIPDDETTTEVPADLPQDLRDISLEVTQGAETPAAKAAAIQAYFRDSNRFAYSTQRRPGSGYQALESFLADRSGYCEQFATAMAMMARVNRIPSRVAVGFLPGERQGDQWQVSVNKMHAWPELYFANYGWVRYEPTPAVQTGTAPAWTQNVAPAPSESASASASTAPSSSAPSVSTAPTEAPTTAASDDPSATSTRVSVRAVLLGAGGVVLLLVLAAPATIRVRRRQGRLDGQGPTRKQVEAAWAELRDTVLDYGGSWPSGTPRRIGDELAQRLEPEDAEAVGRVATLVERSRFSRSLEPGPETQQLPETTQHLRRAIATLASRWQRVRALLAPRSLFRRH